MIAAHREYTRERLQRLEERLSGAVYPERVPVGDLLLAGPVDRIEYAAAQALEYRRVAPGEQLGPLFATYWLRAEATVPEAWAGARVDLVLDTRSEATLWLGGRAVQGLNSSGTQPRPDATLVDRARGGERVGLRGRDRLQRPVRPRRRGPG